jgi:CBS-domain-containing membrane protein
MISGFKEKSLSPSKVVGPSTQSAGTVLSMFLGVGPGVAIVAALTALIVLPLLRGFHPPGIALAMYPALLHPGPWFAVQVVLPFTLAAVISCPVLCRLLSSWPRYRRRFEAREAQIESKHGGT